MCRTPPCLRVVLPANKQHKNGKSTKIHPAVSSQCVTTDVLHTPCSLVAHVYYSYLMSQDIDCVYSYIHICTHTRTHTHIDTHTHTSVITHCTHIVHTLGAQTHIHPTPAHTPHTPSAHTHTRPTPAHTRTHPVHRHTHTPLPLTYCTHIHRHTYAPLPLTQVQCSLTSLALPK